MPHGTERPEPCQTGRLHRALGLFRPTPEGELVADHFPIMTIDHRRQMCPAVLPTGDMRYIHGPPFVASTPPTGPALHARTWGGDTLMHEPPLLLEHAVDRLPIHNDSIPESQQHPQSPISKCGILLNPLPQPLHPRRVSRPPASLRHARAMQVGSAHPQHLTAPPL